VLERQAIDLREWLRALRHCQVMQTWREATINREHDCSEACVDNVTCAEHGVRNVGIRVGAADAKSTPRCGITADRDADDASQSGECESRRLAATHIGSLAVIRLRAAHARLALLGLF
jgi:hypothetical protein